MHVTALRRNAAEPDAVVQRYFHGADGLREMCRRADYLLLATPLTADTKGLVSAEVLACMQKRAVFVNVGRGPCVDEPALVRALQEGRLRGAALDVFAVEPLPVESPLWGLPNVLLSPHNADRTADFQQQAVSAFLANLRKWEAGEPMELHVVDKAAGY